MQELQNYIRAGYGVLMLETAEYFRCVNDVLASVSQMETNGTYVWDASGRILDAKAQENISSAEFTLTAALGFILDKMEQEDAADAINPTLWVLMDAHLYFREVRDPTLVALFRRVAQVASTSNHHLILVGAGSNLCPELETYITTVKYAMPDSKLFAQTIADVADTVGLPKTAYNKKVADLTVACAGMTNQEAFDALTLSSIVYDGFNPKFIMTEKAKAVSKSGALTYTPSDLTVKDVGGLDQLISYINLRKNSFSPKAVKFGCPPPKGILLVGPPGTGKTLIAKVTASILKRPLITLDVGAVFASLVGESEDNMRSVIRVVEALAPCVLLVDEIEKSMSTNTSSKSDGGTGSRVLATLLTWMAEKTSEVYIVATANDVTKLPPELIRKGRLDELFFTDTPSEEEKKEIFKIHLKKVNRNPRDFNITTLAKAAKEFTGAEIEQSIADALYVAFDEGTELTTAHIKAAVLNTTPLALINEEEVTGLREWAEKRCRAASSKVAVTTKKIVRPTLASRKLNK